MDRGRRGIFEGPTVNRYHPARQHRPASMAAAGLALFSAWCGMSWGPALIPAALFIAWAVILHYLATRPVIEVHEAGFRIGSEMFYWHQVARLDSTVWNSPLMLHVTLRNRRKVRLLYPGDIDSCRRLLRQMRRMARDAVIDGLTYSEYWSETLPARVDHERLTAPMPRIVRAEDEEEIERLFQQLKTAGSLDSKTPAEDRQD